MAVVMIPLEDWEHFLSRINFGASYLDARAIRIMNEAKVVR